MRLLLPLLLCAPASVGAFVPSISSSSTASSSTESTARRLKGRPFLAGPLHVSVPGIEDVEASRRAFYIWFFGASGAAGIARSSLPRLYTSFVETWKLKGVGPTEGGATIGLPLALVGYPQDLSIADLQKVVQNKATVEEIVARFPVENNMWSAKGYLTFDAFAQAHVDCNPLAVRAVFDTLSQATNMCEPAVAQAKLDAYQQSLDTLPLELIKAKVQGYAAVVVLLFLLGLADVVAAGHAYHGWFPEWPGGQNFPACLLDPETGPWTIPDYWMSD